MKSVVKRWIGVAACVACALSPSALRAQQTDSLRPPLTPRRAFFYSFFLPGYSQTKLGRHKAAATFLSVEALSLIMIRESGADVREARRMSDDTVIVSWVDAAGNKSPVTQLPHFDGNYVRARRAHVEDWVALLVANHLFAGADAFVAAHLWDVGAHLGFRVLPGQASVSASLKW